MSFLRDNSNILPLTNSAIAVSKVYQLNGADSVSYQLAYTDATPAVASFVAANVNATTDVITVAAHGFSTGLKVALTGTNLPGGLSATNYWVIVLTVNTIQLATSLANAVAGTQVDITSAGTTANAALTPVSLATTGVVIKLQQSNDGVTFFDVSGVTVTVTASGNTLWLVTNPPTLWHKILVTPATGSINLAIIVANLVTVNQ